MKLKHILFTALISAVTSAALVIGMGNYFKGSNSYAGQESGVLPANYKLAGFTEGGAPNGAVPDFMQPAEVATPTVVHIKTKTNAKQINNNLPRVRPNNPFGDLLDDDMFNQLFGGRSNVIPEQRASGSGVIISDNGYIVTNNHVIEGAKDIKVVLDDRRSYSAKVIGVDPTTDLALLKIDEKGLHFIRYGNSDDTQVGEWVLAIGNPFDLNSTVTAGIVSAKARNINLLKTRSNLQVESFIQTDAAVNPGNSGGALVNLRGELIGINTAIASNTGSYAGYSFAVPSALVRKVVDDLFKYGEVQRALLGVIIREVTADLAKEKNLKEVKGIYVQQVNKGSAAAEMKLKPGDVILKVAGKEVNAVSELTEYVARFRPGDKITVTYLRNGDVITASGKLKSKLGNEAITMKEELKSVEVPTLSAVMQPLSSTEKEDLGIKGGVKVVELKEGILSQSGMEEGFIITHIDKKAVSKPEEVERIVRKWLYYRNKITTQ